MQCIYADQISLMDGKIQIGEIHRKWYSISLSTELGACCALIGLAHMGVATLVCQ